MHGKYTELVTIAQPGLSRSPEDSCVVSFNTKTYELREHQPNHLLPQLDLGEHYYTVSPETIDTCIHIPGAIACTRPDGSAFHPGMCLHIQFSYNSPIGLQQLLRQYFLTRKKVPQLISLENLYELLIPEMVKICANAAQDFANSQALPYEHWWNDIRYKTGFRNRIYTPLWQLFFSYGFQLDEKSFAITGLAPVPMA